MAFPPRIEQQSVLKERAYRLLASVLAETDQTEAGPIGPVISRFKAHHEEDWPILDALVRESLLEQVNHERYRVKIKGLLLLDEKKSVEIVQICSRVFQALRNEYKERQHQPVPISQLASELGLQRKDLVAALIYLRDTPIWGGYSTDLTDAKASVTPGEGILKYKDFDSLLDYLREQYGQQSNKLIFRQREQLWQTASPRLSKIADAATSVGLDQAITPLLSADRPIMSKSEDRLRRSHFTKQLSDVIKEWRGRDSLVVALYGAWGSGKTSIKNLILECLREHKEGLEIVEFNPWQWSGHQEISGAFFLEIGKTLGRADPGKAEKLTKTLKAYSAFLDVNREIIASVPQFFFLITMVFGLMGFGFSFTDAATSVIQRLVAGVVVVVSALGLSKSILKAIASWSEHRSALYQKTLSELKNDLSAQLRTLTRPVLVVIDDIDRLTREEVKAVFQLVKANADFPNFIYLLPFERSTTAKALTDEAVDGQAFLEKIVQIGFDIPQPNRADIDAVLSEKLNIVFASELSTDKFSRNRWLEIYHGGLKQYFSGLRDVNRFVASLAFYVELLRTEGIMDVNPVDLVAVEVLRLFEPQVYVALRDAKEMMVGDLSTAGESRNMATAEITNIIEAGSLSRRDSVKEIMKLLFPNREWVFGGMSYAAEFHEEWRRELRICSKDLFDRYFQLKLQEGDISGGDIKNLLSVVGDQKRFVEILRRFATRGQLVSALEELNLRVDEVDVAHSGTVLTGLFDIGDMLPEAEPGLFSIGPEWTVQRIVRRLLEREGNGRRVEVLASAIAQAEGLSMAVMRVSLEDDREHRESSALFEREGSPPISRTHP